VADYTKLYCNDGSAQPEFGNILDRIDVFSILKNTACWLSLLAHDACYKHVGNIKVNSKDVSIIDNISKRPWKLDLVL